MSVASLREALEAEIAVLVLAGEEEFPRGAGTDLFHWNSGPPDYLRQLSVFQQARAGITVEHLPAGTEVLASTDVVFGSLRGTRAITNGMTRLLVTEPELLSDAFLRAVLEGSVLDP